MITQQHFNDVNGNPAGGYTTGKGIGIEWQNGPLDGGPNGAFVEEVIKAAIGRLKFYQGGKFAGRENALAITKLEEALHWLRDRTDDRKSRGVEGTHEL